MAHFFKGRVPSIALQIRMFLDELIINMKKTTRAFKTVVQNTYLWGRELGTGRWAHSDLQIESTQWSLGIWLAVAQFPIGPSFDCSGYGKAFPFPSVC